MNIKTSIEKYYLNVFEKICYAAAYTLISSIFFSHAVAVEFSPPSLNSVANSFNNRVDPNNFNVDFIVAHVLNNARQTVRRVGEKVVRNNENNTLLTSNRTTQDNSSVTSSGAISNSVVVPIGVDIKTIIIINQNEGDSYAIQR